MKTEGMEIERAEAQIQWVGHPARGRPRLPRRPVRSKQSRSRETILLQWFHKMPASRRPAGRPGGGGGLNPRQQQQQPAVQSQTVCVQRPMQAASLGHAGPERVCAKQQEQHAAAAAHREGGGVCVSLGAGPAAARGPGRLGSVRAAPAPPPGAAARQPPHASTLGSQPACCRGKHALLDAPHVVPGPPHSVHSVPRLACRPPPIHTTLVPHQ
jgi:hypothetical protein